MVVTIPDGKHRPVSKDVNQDWSAKEKTKFTTKEHAQKFQVTLIINLLFSIDPVNFISLPRISYYFSLFIFALLYLDPCLESPCKNGGTCVSFLDKMPPQNGLILVRYYNCNCVEGYFGIHCENGIVFMIL